MIRIRPEQMRAFQSEADRRFYQSAADHLCREYPKLTDELTNEVLREMVMKGVARARGYDFHWQSSMIRFVELMLTIAPNFDQVPAIRERLLNRSGTEAERMARLMEDTTFSEWRQAASDYDPEAWGVNLHEHPALFELRGAFPR